MPVRRHRLEDDWTGKKNTRERIGKPLTRLGREGRKMLAQSKKARNRKNKASGTRLENEVAKIVKGKRVPMSGAAQGFKGDVQMPIPNQFAIILLECKSRQNNNRIGIDTKKWLDKIEVDTASNTSALAGGLVFRFSGDRQHYYLFLPLHYAEKLNAHFGDVLDIPEEVWYDASQKPNGQGRAIANFPRITTNAELDKGSILRVQMATWNDLHYLCTGKRDYILLYLDDFVRRIYKAVGVEYDE